MGKGKSNTIVFQQSDGNLAKTFRSNIFLYFNTLILLRKLLIRKLELPFKNLVRESKQFYLSFLIK